MRCSMDGTLGVPDEMNREHNDLVKGQEQRRRRRIAKNAIGKQTRGTP